MINAQCALGLGLFAVSVCFVFKSMNLQYLATINTLNILTGSRNEFVFTGIHTAHLHC